MVIVNNQLHSSRRPLAAKTNKEGDVTFGPDLPTMTGGGNDKDGNKSGLDFPLVSQCLSGQMVDCSIRCHNNLKISICCLHRNQAVSHISGHLGRITRRGGAIAAASRTEAAEVLPRLDAAVGNLRW